MKIKPRSTKKKKRHFIDGVEIKEERQYQRLPQLNKAMNRRNQYGFSPLSNADDTSPE